MINGLNYLLIILNSTLIFLEYSSECETNYSNHLSCLEIKYKVGSKIKIPNDNKFRIELYHDIIKEI